VCSRFVRRRFLLLVRSPKNPLNVTDLTPAKSIVLCPQVLRLLPQSPTPAPAVKAGEVLNRNSSSPSCFGDTKYCNVKSRYRFDGYLFIIFFLILTSWKSFRCRLFLMLYLDPPPPTAFAAIEFESGIHSISITVCRQWYTVSIHLFCLVGENSGGDR